MLYVKCFTYSATHQFSADGILKYFLIFLRKQDSTFHANCLQVTNCFLEQIRKLSWIFCLLKIAQRVLSINFQQIIFWIIFLIFPRISNRDSLHKKLCWLQKKRKKISSNILSAKTAQRVVKIWGTSKLHLHWATF